MSREDPVSAAELERAQRAVRDLGSMRADRAFRTRLREEFVTGAITEGVETESRRARLTRIRGWILLPAAAATVAAIWLLVLTARPTWEPGNVTGTGTVTVSVQDGSEVEVELRDTARLAGLIHPGAHIRLGEQNTLDLIAGDVLLLQLDGQAALTVPANPRSGEVMGSRLDAGELRIRTGPGFTGQRLSVRTTEGRAELSGTVVSVFKGSDFTCVCVLEGTARIGGNEATIEDVPAGMRKVMFADGRPSMVVAAEPQHLEDLTRFVETTRGVLD